MKPLHLNLASRPYRDYRPLYAVVVALSLLIAFLALKNIETYYEYINATRSTRQRIEKLDADAAQERRRLEVVRNQLASIDVVALDQQTRFINAKLAERTFSWSELLDHLEDILADDVRIKTIAPSFQKSGLITLTMQFEAKTADGMIRTINAFNATPSFSNPFPNSETQTESNTYTFALQVDYQPQKPKVIQQTAVTR
ncbi:MAG TPA: hypothetical protein VF698_01420 [Thermoanaerobaculia bacterium]